ncbi:MAG: ABC transporter permease [Candidatus Cloacimonetes bacterium]|nr:ABC transporter permease [Candidatus Cloacimonadota bacterium]
MKGLGVLSTFIKKEFRQIMRSREMLLVLFLLPAIQLLVMGFAVTNEVKHIDISFFDLDRSIQSRRLMEAFSSTDRFHLVEVGEQDRPELQLFRWKSKVVIVIPAGFERKLAQGRIPALQLLLDGIDGNTASIANAYVQSCVKGFTEGYLRGKDPRRVGYMLQGQKASEIIIQMSFNPDLQSNLNIIPGIIAVLVTVTSMLLSAISLVKEKELGTLEQLLVTPVKKYQLLIGKILPYLLITLLQLQVAVLLAGLIFGIRVAGSYWVLTLFSIVYLFTSLGFGIFISTRVESQQQAMFFSWFMMVIMILLSGFFVPVQNMPQGVRWVSFANPLTHYMTVLREIVVKGSGLMQLKEELLVLLGGGMLVFGFGILSFRKRV